MPNSKFSSNTKIPCARVWVKPNSSEEQIIPSDGTPRSTTGFITILPTRAPKSASGTFCPRATFGAPHTTRCVFPPPKSSVTKCKWSELGWSSILMIWATRTPSKSAPVFSTEATSIPRSVSFFTNSSGVKSISIKSLSQEYKIFIIRP